MCATKIKSKPQVYSRPRSVKAYSIYHVLHQYQTTSLHVRPISWSDQHAKIFKVEWDHLERSQHPTPNITLPTIDTPQNVIELSQHLSTLFTTRETTPYSDLSCVMSILWRLFPDRHPTVESRPDSLLPFWLGGRPNNSAVKLQAVWELSDNPEVNDCSFSTESTMPFDSESTSVADTASFGGINDDEAIKEKESPKYHARPVMAYVSRDRLNLLRHGMFRIPAGPKRCANMPVINLHRKRAIKLRPAIPDEDMYLAAAFISMAQRYFYPRVIGSEKSFDPEQIRPFEDVKLRILVSDAASEDFIVYTTTVTKELLSALHNPRTLVMPGYGPLSAMSSLKITTQHVAARPIYGLRERLGKALGDVFGESFGEFPGIETELWGEDSTLAQSIINQARPPWGANPRPSINTARNQEQLVRRQLKLKATPGLKRRASERERAMRKDDTENKSRHEPLVLPFPPMPEGQEQKAPPSLKRKEGDGMSELHEEETVRVKRRRSMAL
ncbi:uncharacterized protein BROUX77_007432 [Berkeleyomyces rouxiae]|uniref:uncharacterized protein n=1 Tax=Berkeleyomyces rouxiae TaxID=2035830 RepID=UPI003B7B845C